MRLIVKLSTRIYVASTSTYDFVALCMNVNISTPKPLTPDSTQIRDTSSNLTIEHLPREVESLAISNASPKTENAGSVTDATNQET